MGRTAKSEPTTSSPKTPTSKKRKAEELNDESNDFVIQCPAKPIPKKNGIADVHRDRDDPNFSALAIDFTVRPGSKWTGLKTYRNVKCTMLSSILHDQN